MFDHQIITAATVHGEVPSDQNQRNRLQLQRKERHSHTAHILQLSGYAGPTPCLHTLTRMVCRC